MLLGVFPLVASLVTAMRTPLHSFVVMSTLEHHTVRHPNGAARESVASEPCSTRNIQQNFDSYFTTSVDCKACRYGAHRALPLQVPITLCPSICRYCECQQCTCLRVGHGVLQGGTTLQMPSPWRRDMVALQSDLNKVQHEDEDQGAAITKSLDQLMRMRSQAQSSVAAGAPTSPGSASGYASGSDAENIPDKNVLHTSDSDAENVPDENAVGRVPLDEDDTVCYGGSQGAPVSHGGSAMHGEGDASDVGATEVALAPSGAFTAAPVPCTVVFPTVYVR